MINNFNTYEKFIFIEKNSELLNNKENILIVGSGGREHAIGWKISQSPNVGKIYYSPGNGGTFENIEVNQNDFEKIASYAKNNSCLTIVGPEEPLSLGIVDYFNNKKLRIFGPTMNAAKLESSKIFAKEFMIKNNIPTANFQSFDDANEARKYVSSTDGNVVVKADGLASGKGVFVCNSQFEAIEAINKLMIKKEFGISGEKIIIEEKIFGDEVSFIGISDGKVILPLATSQDHKRAYDDDKGPNTGGMGSYSPAPLVDETLYKKIMDKIMIPTIGHMKNNNIPFKGFLYAGLMINNETNEPYVLEYNVRLGDPECQSILTRMESDLYEYIDASVEERLNQMLPIKWKSDPSVCVVLVEKGYPNKYEKGHKILGLNNINNPKTVVFHAGTQKNEKGEIITTGGRVLSVTSTGENFSEAISNTYQEIKKISFGEKNSQYYRQDIGRRVVGF